MVNPSAKVGDMGSIPGRRRSHMSGSNQVCAPQLLSLCSRVRGLQLLSPRAATTEACVPQSLRSTAGETTAVRSRWPQPDNSPCLPQLESCPRSNKDPAQPKISKLFYNNRSNGSQSLHIRVTFQSSEASALPVKSGFVGWGGVLVHIWG